MSVYEWANDVDLTLVSARQLLTVHATSQLHRQLGLSVTWQWHVRLRDDSRRLDSCSAEKPRDAQYYRGSQGVAMLQALKFVQAQIYGSSCNIVTNLLLPNRVTGEHSGDILTTTGAGGLAWCTAN